MPLKVLSVLDTARTRYYHIKAVIVAGKLTCAFHISISIISTHDMGCIIS